MGILKERIILVKFVLSTGETVEIENTLHMDVKIKKTTAAASNEADIRVINLNRDVAKSIIEASAKIYTTRTTRNKCTVYVTAGSADGELSDIFAGDVVTARLTGDTDQVLEIKAQTGFYGNLTQVARSFPQKQTTAKTVCESLANTYGVELKFDATNVPIYRYSFSGDPSQEMRMLLSDYGVACTIDDNVLLARDIGAAANYDIKVVNADTQMIGYPELDEHGVKVVALFDAQFKIGGKIDVSSVKNPAANGQYVVHEVNYDLSNYAAKFEMALTTAKPKEKGGKAGGRKRKRVNNE